jgi:hypothetical protein
VIVSANVKAGRTRQVPNVLNDTFVNLFQLLGRIQILYGRRLQVQSGLRSRSVQQVESAQKQSFRSLVFFG